jgi:hypothetical protein
MELTATHIQKYKSKSIPALLRLAEEAFNAYIRERDRLKNYGDGQYFYCPTCRTTKRIQGNNYHACHCFPAGHYSWLKFNEDNCFGGCLSCNYYKHGAAYEYNDWVRDKIGEERYQKLKDLTDYYRRTGWKWDRYSLIETIFTYREKIKKLK